MAAQLHGPLPWEAASQRVCACCRLKAVHLFFPYRAIAALSLQRPAVAIGRSEQMPVRLLVSGTLSGLSWQLVMEARTRVWVLPRHALHHMLLLALIITLTRIATLRGRACISP